MVNHDGHLLLSEGDARGGWPIRVPGCVAKRLKHGGCFASLIISKASIGWKDLQRREMTPIAKKGVVLSVSVTFEIGGGGGGIIRMAIFLVVIAGLSFLPRMRYTSRVGLSLLPTVMRRARSDDYDLYNLFRAHSSYKKHTVSSDTIGVDQIPHHQIFVFKSSPYPSCHRISTDTDSASQIRARR